MSLTGTTNEEKIWNYLIGQGMTAQGVAGLMGNMQAESGFSPNNMENAYESRLGYNDTTYTQAVDNGTYTNFVKDAVGYGILKHCDSYNFRVARVYPYVNFKKCRRIISNAAKNDVRRAA